MRQTRRALPGRPQLLPFVAYEADEGCRDRRIELCPGTLLDLVQGMLHWLGGAVGTVVGDGVERFDDREDSCGEWNLFAAKSARVSIAVPAFVLGVDDVGGDAAEVGHLGDDALAESSSPVAVVREVGSRSHDRAGQRDTTQREWEMATSETSARLDVVRRGYDAFQTGDMDTLRSLLASDVSWHTPGQGAGEFHGIDNVIAEFGRLFEDSGGTFRVTVNEIMEGPESVVVLAHSTATRAGKTLDQPYAHIFRFDGDHVSESWVIGYDQAASAAFWD